MIPVLFVSVNQTFRSTYSIPEMESCVERAWPISVAKASRCDRVVAVVNGCPVAAWRLRGAFPTDETYRVVGDKTSPRIGLSLGDPIPVLEQYQPPASMRRGVAVVECPVEPFLAEQGRAPLFRLNEVE